MTVVVLLFTILQSFRGWCVLAYECGYREEDLLLKLTEACDTKSSPVPAASVPACLESVCLIWETLEQSAKPIKRWAKGVCSATSPTQSHDVKLKDSSDCSTAYDRGKQSKVAGIRGPDMPSIL